MASRSGRPSGCSPLNVIIAWTASQHTRIREPRRRLPHMGNAGLLPHKPFTPPNPPLRPLRRHSPRPSRPRAPTLKLTVPFTKLPLPPNPPPSHFATSRLRSPQAGRIAHSPTQSSQSVGPACVRRGRPHPPPLPFLPLSPALTDDLLQPHGARSTWALSVAVASQERAAPLCGGRPLRSQPPGRSSRVRALRSSIQHPAHRF